jgi:hypothetical protein
MRRTTGLILVLALLTAGCGGPPVDLTKSLEVLDVSTSWWDFGVVAGENKLVPQVSFRVKNNSDQVLRVLQLNVLFRRVTEPDVDWGSGFLMNPAPGGLEPGETTELLNVKSQLGYKGTEARDVMMKNSAFVDVKVDLYAKYASQQWKRIAEIPVERTLITP